MTPAQKKSRENFKKAVAEAKKLRAKNPKLSQAQAVKQAWAILYSTGKVGKTTPKKKVTKKAASSIHKDTKSHNVNVKVVSGYNGTTRHGKFTNVHYTRMTGYKQKPEIIVSSIGKISSLSDLVPAVKLRVSRSKTTSTKSITSVKDSADVFKKFIGRNKIQTQEFFAVMYLKNNNQAVGLYLTGMGSITSVVSDIRLILAGALNMAATGIIICHNHPSGNLQPSQADITYTKDLVKAANQINVNVIDHIIITKDGYYSFVQNNLIK